MKRKQCCGLEPVWLLIVALGFSSWVHGEKIQLSLRRAVELAVQEGGNLTVQLFEEKVSEARADASLARSALLPHLGGQVSERKQTVNLEAFGIQGGPGFRPPKLVGPFTTFDARASLRQTVFDMGVIRRYQASKAGVRAAREQDESFKDRIAAETAREYLRAVSAGAVLETAEADVLLAEELLGLAERQKEAGTGTGIEITRAKVRLSVARQEKLQAENGLRHARLSLLRLIGMDLRTDVELVDPLTRVSVQPVTFEQALQTAMESRKDVTAQREKLRAMKLAYEGARMDRVPSLQGFADYGAIGLAPNDSIPTWAVGVTLNLPVFDGGAVDARRAKQLSQFRQEQIRSDDLNRAVELEIRLVLQTLSLVGDQVEVAEAGVLLAGKELEQAARRYRAGVATSLEVTEAQTQLKNAQQGRISALYSYNLARMNLLEAMGTLRKSL